MKRKIMLCAILSGVLGAPVSLAAQTSPPSGKGFADWLFMQEEYERAAGEYYRVLFDAPPAEQDGLLFTIGTCYVKAGEYRKALLVFERIIEVYPQSSRLEDAYYQAAYCSYKLGEYRAAFDQIHRLTLANGALPPRFLLLTGAGSLLSDDWDGAGLLLSTYLLNPDVPHKHEVSALLDLADEASRPEERSGPAAGLFSALLPGVGKMYAGNWGDGLVSLLLCGFLGGMAAYHFVNDGVGSAPAWIYAVLGGVFYAGNIYGSVVAAEQYNERRRDSLRQRIQTGVRAILP
jgi:tetratricopeptide (TPR) repeat protein